MFLRGIEKRLPGSITKHQGGPSHRVVNCEGRQWALFRVTQFNGWFAVGGKANTNTIIVAGGVRVEPEGTPFIESEVKMTLLITGGHLQARRAVGVEAESCHILAFCILKLDTWEISVNEFKP